MNIRYFLTVIAGAFSAVALAVIFPSLVPAHTPVTEVLGAPDTQVTFQKNLIPVTDSTYTLGTTTKTWLNLYTDEICLAGDCQTAWPVGGSGSFASSSPWTNGYLAYVVDNNTFSSVATGTLTENLTGLEFDATRGLVGGSAVLTLTSGYEIPTTTRMITWDTAYGWGDHSLAGYDQVTTAGDGLTRTGNDFDCDTASGSVFGCLASADWTTFNNKQATISVTHPILLSGATLSLAFSTTTANSWSSLQTFTYASTTSLTSSGKAWLTYASTTGISGTNSFFTTASSTNLYASVVNFGSSILSLASRTMTALGIWDFGGADSLEIPNGTGPTVDATGETAVDTTSDQFVYFGASAKKVLGNGNEYQSFTYATTTAWTGTTTLPLGPAIVAETWNSISCFSDAGTLYVSVGDGTNYTNTTNASTTVGLTTLTSNNTFTAGEKRYFRAGTPASSPTTVSCTISKSLTAD